MAQLSFQEISDWVTKLTNVHSKSQLLLDKYGKNFDKEDSDSAAAMINDVKLILEQLTKLKTNSATDPTNISDNDFNTLLNEVTNTSSNSNNKDDILSQMLQQAQKQLTLSQKDTVDEKDGKNSGLGALADLTSYSMISDNEEEEELKSQDTDIDVASNSNLTKLGSVFDTDSTPTTPVALGGGDSQNSKKKSKNVFKSIGAMLRSDNKLLFDACHENKLSQVKEIIKKHSKTSESSKSKKNKDDFDINSKHGALNQTCLHAACDGHNSEINNEIVQLLIENGADLNAVDSNGDTALHTVANANFIFGIYTFEFIFRNFATKPNEFPLNPNLRNNKGQTILWLSAAHHRFKQLWLLFEYFGPNGSKVQSNDELTAPKYNILDVINTCDTTEELGATPLYMACSSYTTTKCTELLLSHGADINIANKHTQTYIYLYILVTQPTLDSLTLFLK